MSLATTPYKGTRDYYPEDKAVQNHIFAIWRHTAQSFGYREYATPLLEPLELYSAKSGQELAGEQTYCFTDRGGRTVAIRPELTPSVSRLVAGRRQNLAYPAKLFSIANLMRYERPQKGREREFWQLNLDTFGADTAAADIEALQLADQLLRAFGADSDMYDIRVNHRGLGRRLLTEQLGADAAVVPSLMRLIDRRAKLPPAVFADQVGQLVGQAGLAQLEETLACQQIDQLPAPLAATPEAERLRQVLAGLAALGVRAARYDPSLVRGLDYYTGIIFEVFDRDPANARSLFGGGRYDGLVGLFGVEPIGAVGFAPGLTTTELFLRGHGLLPELNTNSDYVIIPLGPDDVVPALTVAQQLRARGRQVDVDTSGRKLDRALKAAVKKATPAVIILGADEIAGGYYTVKRLATGQTTRLALADL